VKNASLPFSCGVSTGKIWKENQDWIQSCKIRILRLTAQIQLVDKFVHCKQCNSYLRTLMYDADVLLIHDLLKLTSKWPPRGYSTPACSLLSEDLQWTFSIRSSVCSDPSVDYDQRNFQRLVSRFPTILHSTSKLVEKTSFSLYRLRYTDFLHKELENLIWGILSALVQAAYLEAKTSFLFSAAPAAVIPRLS
jgi:hypothetical protein